MRVGTFHWEPQGFAEILNGPAMRLALLEKAKEGEGIAQEVYAAQSKHQEKGPTYYDASFFTELREEDGFPVARLGNRDPEWFFIEFGLWAGGGGHLTRTYRYRVFGHVLDLLEAGAHL